ncbi:MAG: leucyl aminopeptidase family protein [Cocleimonas sp.]|nr:leucyl aminopeptidase family protein [Cocleimonas sp.]
MSYITDDSCASIALVPVTKVGLTDFLAGQSEFISNWVNNSSFKAKPHDYCLVPDKSGNTAMVLFGLHAESKSSDINTNAAPIWAISNLAKKLPVAIYHLDCDWDDDSQLKAMIGWGLGSYSFDFFKKDFLDPKPKSQLKVAENKLDEINAYVDAFTLVRDLVNTPANHMMPEDLSELTQELAQQHGAEFSEVVGDKLLEENFPAIHAVGRASDHPPRLIKLEWGNENDPLVSLVGKGVCFDTGGLDLKPSKFMRNMKKDMGGSAHVLGLAHLIMSHKLPVRMQVLVAAADNAISGDAFRPGDIIETRAHKTVEIDNTDAEGRLVLCDALTLACETEPDLILDFATLTGAARVAVGTEIPALFSNSNQLSLDIQNAAENTGEMVWPLPLHQGYRHELDSPVADLVNSSPNGYGGAITAALYLNEFVDADKPWAHFDVMAWNMRERAGRPKGGEAMGLLVAFKFLQKRYV